MNSVIEVMFYRRIVDGWEFAYNKLFSHEFKARKYLRLSGFKLIEDNDNLYHGKNMRAVIVEKEIE